MKHTPVMVGILLFVALSHLGHADTMRCGDTGPVVSSGDTTADVLTKCGAPTQREKRQECREPPAGRPRTGGQGSSHVTDCITVDMWTYNFGPHRLVAADWRSQVGDDGDGNRVLNSDPVLWKFAGDVNGLTVLDAGCGTGYLSKKLRDQGARVTGIDFSERMIEIARTQNPDMDFRVDSCFELVTLH